MFNNQKGGFVIILLILIALVVMVGVGYYIGTKYKITISKQNAETAENLESQAVMSAPLTSPAPSSNPLKNKLPSDWTFEQSAYCDIRLPIPPKKEPYYIPDDPNTPPAVNDEGAWWLFQERSHDADNDKFFSGESYVVFENPEITGHDYLAGIVQVICGPNNKGYTTESYVNDYSKQFTDGTFSGLNFKKIGEKDLWGRKVIEAQTDGMYEVKEYYLATPSMLFQIKQTVPSTNPVIKETAQKIFENLQFSN